MGMGGMPIERRLIRWWAEHALDLGLRPATLAVVMVVLTRINADGVAWPGRDRIMREAGIRSPRAFHRAIKEAVGAGLIVVERRGRMLSNLYWAGPALAARPGGPDLPAGGQVEARHGFVDLGGSSAIHNKNGKTQ